MVVEPYNDQWPRLFEQIRSYLSKGLAVEILGIEHVGSTSIPGMIAKPIIDIDIVIRHGTFDDVKSHLTILGYTHQGDKGLKGREAFKYGGSNDLYAHHLYVMEAGNIHLKKHLTFRNYLLDRPEKVKEVCLFKMRIAEEAGQDRKRYQILKEASEFMEMIVEEALNDPHITSKYST